MGSAPLRAINSDCLPRIAWGRFGPATDGRGAPHREQELDLFNKNGRPGCDASPREKLQRLKEILDGTPRLAVAYSGGTDSAFLAWHAREALGKEVVPILAVSALLSAREREAAREAATLSGLLLEEIAMDPLAVPAIRENGPLRCYHCKKEIMGLVLRRAKELGCTLAADGSHAEDLQVNRPGRRAIEELGIASPLAEAGLAKADIRALSREAGIPTWSRASQSCLAARVAYGMELTPELLAAIERAEDILWGLGCKQARVRVHEGLVARIEVDQDAFGSVMAPKAREAVLDGLLKLGFRFVSLDLAGFRSGSWDGAS